MQLVLGHKSGTEHLVTVKERHLIPVLPLAPFSQGSSIG
jgi:hypothetical protein